MQLKLTVEPIPTTSAGESLNRLLPKSQWDRIRKRVYAEYNYKCVICGVEPRVEPIVKPKIELPESHPEFKRIHPLPRKRRLECHEVWEYDEAAHVQRLIEFIALCSPCHNIKHWNWARSYLTDGVLHKGGTWSLWDDEERFIGYRKLNPTLLLPEDHFMEVNECNLKTLKEHVKEAAELCFRRSHHNWRVDFGDYVPS